MLMVPILLARSLTHSMRLCLDQYRSRLGHAAHLTGLSIGVLYGMGFNKARELR